MNEQTQTSFNKKDLIVSLIVGEISAWLLLILARGILSAETYLKIASILKILPIIFPLLCLAFLYIAYLVSKKIVVIYQIAKFVLIGGFNTLVDWGILSLAIFFFRIYAHVEPTDTFFSVSVLAIAFYSLYKAISFVIAATNSYFWNKFWTFKRESAENMGKEFLQFFLVTFFGFLINVGIASGVFKLVTPPAGLSADQWAILAAVVATAISMVWNFLGYKFIVFDVKKTEKPKSIDSFAKPM